VVVQAPPVGRVEVLRVVDDDSHSPQTVLTVVVVVVELVDVSHAAQADSVVVVVVLLAFGSH
jgi:hypothetical protein